QQRLGVGGAQVEPPPRCAAPVAVGDTVELLHLDRARFDVVRERLLHPFLGRCHVRDPGVDLPGGEVRGVDLRDLRQPRAALAESAQHVQRREHPGVGEPEVAEVVVRTVLTAEHCLVLGHLRLDERVPHPVRTARPPEPSTSSGTAREVMWLWMMVAWRPASCSLNSSRSPTRAVTADGLTGTPFSSTTKHRSASPSNARPRSASSAMTAVCRSIRFAGSSGFASWLGKVPSSSKYSGTTSRPTSGSPASVPSTAGTVSPAIPLPASTITFSVRIPSNGTRLRRWSA